MNFGSSLAFLHTCCTAPEVINQPFCEGGGSTDSDSLLRKVQGITSPVFHVLTGTGKTAMQKLSMVRIVCDTNEIVKEVIDLLNKRCSSKASVVNGT